ncbi:13E12 repeat family protein, partial [Rathayibacter sp. ZW T2_19]
MARGFENSGWDQPPGSAEVASALASVRGHGDRADALARSAAPVLLAAAEELYAGHRAALGCPEAFARGLSRSESDDLVERSVRAELAVALGVSERVVSRDLLHAQLLVEDLPCTRAALSEARVRWEAGQVICAVAATLPPPSRAAFDARAAPLAVELTPTQLRRRVARFRDELHAEPLAERHVRAREDRAVWVVPEVDGMAVLCALLPAPVAVGAFARLDRIARCLREGDGSGVPGEERTLGQLRADALADLLCDGDVAGTAPGGEPAVSTFVPGVRAEVRLTLAASTAAG